MEGNIASHVKNLEWECKKKNCKNADEGKGSTDSDVLYVTSCPQTFTDQYI